MSPSPKVESPGHRHWPSAKRRSTALRVASASLASLGLHVALVFLSLVAPGAPTAQATEITTVDITTVEALGVPQGSVGAASGEGRISGENPRAGSGARPVQRSDQRPIAPAAEAPKASDSDVAAAETGSPALPAAPLPLAGSSDPGGSSEGSPARLGTPSGAEDGTSLPERRPKMTPKYAALLAGWFGSRFNVRNLGLSEDELRALSANVSISLSEDRRITSFQVVSTSGSSGFDEEVRRTVAGIQASAVPLPPPPDGTQAPSTFTVRFRPLTVR